MAVPMRWPSWPTEPARPPCFTGTSASASVWLGEMTKPPPAPLTIMAAAIAHGVIAGGVMNADEHRQPDADEQQHEAPDDERSTEAVDEVAADATTSPR